LRSTGQHGSKSAALGSTYVTRTASFKLDPASRSAASMFHALLGLRDDPFRDRHLRVVEPGRAGDEDPVAVHHRP
jgi:hypothetical protein